jgi:hypothetical protein
MMLLVPICPYVHVSKLVPWCDDTSALVSWYVVPHCWPWQAGVYFGWPRCACLLAIKFKIFLRWRFPAFLAYTSWVHCMILWLILLLCLLDLNHQIDWSWSCSKNDFVETSRYLFGRSHLGFERFNYFDLTVLIFLFFCIWNFSNNSHPPMELHNFSR